MHGDRWGIYPGYGGADVYSALSTGVVNSCEGPFNQGVSDKYAEVTKYLYPTNHVN